MRSDFAIQLYSIRDITKENYQKGLELVAGLGFENVELAGTYGLSAKEFKKVLDYYGLKAVSAHVPASPPAEELKKQAEALNILNCPACICPAPPVSHLQPELLIEKLLDAQKIFHAAGIQFGYHNHAVELNIMENGQRTIDMIAGAGILLQPDIYWVQYANNDPVSLIEQYSGQIISLHFKEMGKNRENAEFGTGIFNWETLDKLGKKAGATYNILEQEEYSLPVDQSIALCAENINRLFG